VQLPFPIICLITTGEGTAAGVVREAAAAAIDLVQIREPTLAAGVLLRVARDAIVEARGTACRVLVNDRFDVALAANAAGVHLRANSFPAARIRSVAPDGFLIGRSVHGPSEAAAVTREGGCDYLIFGTVFASGSKPTGHPVAGLEQLERVCQSTSLPVIAVGGISVPNARQVHAAGAKGIAAIGLFRNPGSFASTVSKLRHQFDS
jgi:thiamine-phosphate diphosphorylase